MDVELVDGRIVSGSHALMCRGIRPQHHRPRARPGRRRARRSRLHRRRPGVAHQRARRVRRRRLHRGAAARLGGGACRAVSRCGTRWARRSAAAARARSPRTSSPIPRSPRSASATRRSGPDQVPARTVMLAAGHQRAGEDAGLHGTASSSCSAGPRNRRHHRRRGGRAERASELILAVSLAVEQLLTVNQMAHTIAVYPSLSGSLTEAARRLMLPRAPAGPVRRTRSVGGAAQVAVGRARAGRAGAAGSPGGRRRRRRR